ncbi:TlpA family protein disulfide reductase [Algoriphagus sp.]|uniref:TlpA family protein disulfide reductase n=1 Tax=Algoriphagus sp. TaxID=1872435 RepID=UPI00391A564E
MRQLFYSFFLFFNFITASVFSQESPFDGIKGSWYTTDGSNELVLMVMDDFALFESQLWEIDQITSEKVILKNGDTNLELLITKKGASYILEKGQEKITVQAQKSKDLKNRVVGKTDVSNDFFKQDQVLLQGVFLPKAEMPSTITIIYNFAFSDDQLQFTGDVDEKGRFKVIFPLSYPQEVMVRIGNAFFTYFSTPGAKQSMVVDESSFGAGMATWTQVKNIDFMGDLAVENEERRLLNPEFMKVRNYFLTDSMTKSLETEEFMEYRLGLMNSHTQFYQSYFDSIPVSALLQEISLRDARTYAADDLRRYIWLHNGTSGGSLKPIAVPKEYIQEVKKLITNDREDLMTANYAGLMREFASTIEESEFKKISQQNYKLIFEYLNDLDLSNTQKAGVESWYSQVKKEVPRDSLVTSDDFKELMKIHQSQFTHLFSAGQWNHVLSKVSDMESIPRSSIIATFLDMNYLTVGKEIPAGIKTSLAKEIPEPAVLAIVNQKIEEFEMTQNAKFVEGMEISENSENVLAQLKAKFPGKVIYVDVWATWCGPCLSEFKYAETIKKEAPDDVVFAYICAQSDRNTFEAQVKKHNLLGEHYFLDMVEYQQFDKEVNITGFPTYMIITKEGKLLKDGIQRPSSGFLLVNQLKEHSSR